jgi:DNA polymerase elongation subunit (family B)
LQERTENAPQAMITASRTPPAISERRVDPLCNDDRCPEPLEAQRSSIDYEHYLTRQLQPVADAILLFLEADFAALTSRQQILF